ncbi:SDR family oxidoreductase [Frankia sp. AgB1.9]|uniref:SDR family NAD(P)-dependent oxidoreductase n=1 Tax=unclassified Frankia TaxID=2632575 RepID=UPI00193444A4|nr:MULTISPECIES: SDR family oxidoreductase [unclassified Frankia]MBL7488171.1 SDR family oxidoreductase [Frankia sp. AgW1.1]MBL7553225.1 SDR family oxidoreductase [Frankia sp. AgB1.9]MBL7620174.1 SDR family oxidoreductase [Frankia sp. AgB1.8]
MPDQVAIVTGGAGDVGRGVCRALSAAGVAVAALDLDVSKVDGAELALECDVTDHNACAQAVDAVASQLGGVSTLVNMAQAMLAGTPLLDLSARDMRTEFESGPNATLRMMQLCYPHLKARGGGAIINFASGAGTYGLPGLGAYAAAKEAIRGLTKVAAMEWGRDNIRVNAICPVATSDHTADWVSQAVAVSPMGRVGDPETDIGAVVVFLAGPGAFINGRTLQVDGGSGAWR